MILKNRILYEDDKKILTEELLSILNNMTQCEFYFFIDKIKKFNKNINNKNIEEIFVWELFWLLPISKQNKIKKKILRYTTDYSMTLTMKNIFIEIDEKLKKMIYNNLIKTI